MARKNQVKTATDQLIKALEKAAKRGVSPEDIRKQKVSFVMGTIDEEINVTRDRVESILSTMKG